MAQRVFPSKINFLFRKQKKVPLEAPYFHYQTHTGMDLDIDDILADLDRDTTAVNYSSSSFAGPNNNHDQDINTSQTVFNSTLPMGKNAIPTFSTIDDYNRLIVHWKNERCAPELLPYPKLLISRILTCISQQMEKLEIISMNFFDNEQDGSLENDNSSGMNYNRNNMLPLLCMEAELERLKYVVRNYIRCRLFKIDKFTIYLKQMVELSRNENEDEGVNSNTNIPNIQDLMSEEELNYHDKHFHILLQCLNESVLKHLPEYAQAINETENGTNMVDEPDWKKFVFVKVLKDKEPHSNPELKTNMQGRWVYNIRLPEANEDIELSLGGIYVMRYNLIKHLLLEGKVELI